MGDYLDQVFPFLGVRFIAVNEGYDSAQGCGSTVGLDVSLRAMVHELYSRDISEKIRSVRQAKMRRGEYLCAIAFYGYRRSETGKNRLEVDPGAAEVVRRIFRMAAGGMPSVEIAAELNREGVPSPLMYRRANHTDGQRGWKTAGETTYWTRSNVARIVKDRRYTGCLVGHKRTVADLSTKRTEAVPEEEWIVAEHTHEALVTEEVFAQAQGFLRRSAGKGLTRKPYQKFRGLLKCAYCSRTLDWRNCKQPYFSCPTAGVVRDFPCKEIHLDESALEDALLTAIQVQTRLFADAAPEAGEDTERHLQDEIKACQSAASRYKTLLTALFEDYAEERIGRREYLSKKQEIAKQQEETKNRLEELTSQLVQMQGEPKESDIDLGKYAFVKELTREMLVELVKEVRVSGKDMLEIKWNFKESCSKNDEKSK